MNFRNTAFLRVNETKIFLILLALLMVFSILGQIISFGGVGAPVQKHVAKILLGLLMMCGVLLVDLRLWCSFAYPLYLSCLLLLLLVSFLGATKLGAQRWIDLYFFTFQPSEFMKLSLILAIARYYSGLSSFELSETKHHVFPLIITLIPALLILKQPDFGTAALLIGVGVGMIFLSGISSKICWAAAFGFVGICPLGWNFLHEYQKNRILNFLDPERDPLGTGYHILQSKIAVGSGHIWGKGLFCGTQSHLNFLPEKHTDFIFTTISEELGFAGGMFIILTFACLIFFFFWTGNTGKNKFARHMCFGLGLLLFAHVFVNIGMVLGIVPVVGVPLPFLSYGGSSIITFMISAGLMISAASRIRTSYD